MQETSSLLRLTLQQAELENSFLRGMFLTLTTPLVDLRSPKCLTFLLSHIAGLLQSN